MMGSITRYSFWRLLYHHVRDVAENQKGKKTMLLFAPLCPYWCSIDGIEAYWSLIDRGLDQSTGFLICCAVLPVPRAGNEPMRNRELRIGRKQRTWIENPNAYDV
jgi:hypothetical protein